MSLVLLLTAAGVATAKSLYVVSKHMNFGNPIPIRTYDIGPDGLLTFQGQHGAPDHGGGMMGLALDSNSGSLFATYEEADLVLVLDAATMETRHVAIAPGAKNLAGIVYDHDRGLVYVLERMTEKLYSFRWDPANGTLIPAVGSPFELGDAEAYGIALDETNDLLYLASPLAGIHVYDTSTWRRVQEIAPHRMAISVAVDPQRGYLYYGAGYLFSPYLTRYDLKTGSEKEVEIDPNAGVIGLAVDTASGFVYTTTGRDNRTGGDDLLVFTPELELIQTVEDIGNPTGLVVPYKQTSYNPLDLTKTVKTLAGGRVDAEGRPYVVVGDEVTFAISFDPADFNPTQVTLVDQLPEELAFVSATGDGVYGQYDDFARTYTWVNPPMTPGSRTVVELTCRLGASTTPGRVITNQVTITGDQTPRTTIGAEIVALEPTYNPLNIRKAVVAPEDAGGDGSTRYVRPGEQITYRISFDNMNNDRGVDDVVLVDALSRNVEFVSATDDGVFGQYDPVSRTYTWTYPSLAAGEARSVDLVVRLAEDIPVGSVITNTATIKGDLTPEVTKGADVTVAFTALELDKTVASPTGESDERNRPYVSPGQNVTYAIDLRNPSVTVTVTDLMIVDRLPAEVNLVTIDGDGQSGSYDRTTHTFTWRYPSLGPGGRVRLELGVQVNDQVQPGTVVSNVVEVSSRQAAPAQARADVAVRGLRGQMFLKPTYIWRNQSGNSQSLMVVVHLPEGYGRETIMDTPLVLTPGSVRCTDMRIFGTSAQGKILCFFDSAPLLAATKGYGEFMITVTGWLHGGRTFTAESTITILKFGGS